MDEANERGWIYINAIQDALTIARREVSTYVTFISTHKLSAAKMREAIAATNAGKMEVVPGKVHLMISGDTKISGEADSHPHLRCPPLIDADFNPRVQAAMEARSPVGMRHGDVLCMYDGGAHGNEGKLRAEAKSKVDKLFTKKLFLTISEKSLRSRRHATKSCHALNQLEIVHILTGHKLVLPKKKRLAIKENSQTNRGNSIGPVPLCQWSKAWQLPAATKKAIFQNSRRAVGGPVDQHAETTATDTTAGDMSENSGDDDGDVHSGLAQFIGDARSNKKAEKDDTFVVFFHAPHELIVDELVEHLCAGGAIELYAGTGVLALVMIKRRCHYTGLTFNDAHSSELLVYLTLEVAKTLFDANSPLYKPHLRKDKQPAPMGKAKAKSKAKGRQRKKKSEQDVEVAEEGSGSETGSDSDSKA